MLFPRETSKHQRLQEIQPKSKTMSRIFTGELKLKAAGDGQAQSSHFPPKSHYFIHKETESGAKPLLEHFYGETSQHTKVFGYVTNYLKSYGWFCFRKDFC